MGRTSLAAVLAALLLTFMSACGDDDGSDVPDFPTVVTLGEGDIFPGILNSSLAVGENRVSMQLIDADDNPVLDAAVHVSYYDLNDEEPSFKTREEARLITTELSFIDENADSERTTTGTGGVYVTYVTFDRAGDWGAEISVLEAGESEPTDVLYRFNVLEGSIEVGIGEPAPPTVQATTATEPLESIDSSFPLRPEMHTTTVADGLTFGKPLVIAFATPAFCTSRTCGPMLDVVVDPLAIRYADDVTFVHIEPYRLQELRESNQRSPVPAMLEWRLQTEPWLYVVGADGLVAAKFEGIMAIDEVESVLERLLNGDENAPGDSAP